LGYGISRQLLGAMAVDAHGAELNLKHPVRWCDVEPVFRRKSLQIDIGHGP
jgi:hypothetical protein